MKNTVYIFEGVDLCGKTTTAKLLHTDKGWPLVKPWADLSFPEPSLRSISKTLLSLHSSLLTPLICDRFITSELIYGQIEGRNYQYIYELLAEWKDAGVKLLIFKGTPIFEIIEARYKDRGDHMYELEDIKKIYNLYNNLEDVLPEWIRCISFIDKSIVKRIHEF